MSLAISESFDRIPSFKHAPLDHTEPSIRIIRVLPDLSLEGFVQCTLTHGNTEDDYTCLSYTWGDEDTACPILMDAQLFFVRQNLHNFLHVVRKSYPLRPFWIDAVCIDQDTVAERNHQVAQMGAVYTAAAHVIVWLGSSSNIADFFRAWNKLFEDGGSWHWWWMSAEDRRKGAEAGWNEFTNHAYWTRAWITQEIAHSRTLSLLADVVEVHNIRNIIQPPWIGAPEGDERARTHVNIALRDYTEQVLGDTLLSLLRRLPNQECGNPRDRIYSLLGLAAEGTRVDVDYASSDMEFVLMLLESCQRLRCLCGLTAISDVLGGVEALGTGSSVDVHCAMGRRLNATSTHIISIGDPRLVHPEQTNCPLPHRERELRTYELNGICDEQPENCSLEVLECSRKGETQQMGRFTRLVTPKYQSRYRSKKPSGSRNHACQEDLSRLGSNVQSERGVYYDYNSHSWQPDVGTANQDRLRWYRQPGSARIVSNWFRMELLPRSMKTMGDYIMKIPLAVCWSYAHQSRAFDSLEAQLGLVPRTDVRPRQSNGLRVAFCKGALHGENSLDIW